MNNKVVVLDVVGLSPDHFRHPERMPNIASLLPGGRLCLTGDKGGASFQKC